MTALVYRLAGVVLICVVLTTLSDAFLTVPNLLNVLRQTALLFLIASGLTLVVLAGGLDLSIGANVGLSACLVATAVQATGSLWAGVAVGCAAGTAVGLVNGAIVAGLKLKPIIATYGIMWVLNGVTYWYMQGETIYGFPESFRAIGSGYWLGVPVPVYLMVTVLAAGLVFARMTTWGHQVYAMGANQQAALLSGVPVNARTFLVYSLSGAMGGRRRRGVSRPFEFSGSRYRRRAAAACDCSGAGRRYVAVRRAWQPDRHAHWCGHPDARAQRDEPPRHQLELAAAGDRHHRAVGGRC